MRTRVGFVSNSSSTSFVVLLPPKLDLEKLDYSRIREDGDHESGVKEDYVKAIELLMKDRLYARDYNGMNGVGVYRLKDILKDYLVASAENGADGTDNITLADWEKTKNIVTRVTG